MTQELYQPKYLAESTVSGLFPTALIKFKYQIDPKVREQLMAEPMKQMTGDEVAYNHLFSKDDWLLEREEYRGLRDDLEARVSEFANHILAIKGPMIITQCWLNENRPGESTHKHTHPNSIISGVLYLRVPRDSGAIRFHRIQSGDSRGWTFYPDVDEDQAARSYYAFDWCDVGVNEGDLILFPSYASHSVLTNASQESRWSLAFNAVPRQGLTGHSLDTLDFEKLARRLIKND